MLTRKVTHQHIKLTKAGKKNVKTGEPLYKAADHMKEDLLASGVFSEHEITKLIWNEFDTEIEENYRCNERS